MSSHLNLLDQIDRAEVAEVERWYTLRWQYVPLPLSS